MSFLVTTRSYLVFGLETLLPKTRKFPTPPVRGGNWKPFALETLKIGTMDGEGVMDALAQNRAMEITALHNELKGLFKVCLQKAIRLGELLTEQKEALPHGEWTPWIEANLPFSERTARRYMRLFKERALLKTDTMSGLTSAYRLLTAPKEQEDPRIKIEAEAENIERELILLKMEMFQLKELYDWTQAFCANPDIPLNQKIGAWKELMDEATKQEKRAVRVHIDAQVNLGRALNEMDARVEKLREAGKWKEALIYLQDSVESREDEAANLLIFSRYGYPPRR
jgi:hypothetical protein